MSTPTLFGGLGVLFKAKRLVDKIEDARPLSPDEERELTRMIRLLLDHDRDAAAYPTLAAYLSRAQFVRKTIYLRFGDLPEGERSRVRARERVGDDIVEVGRFEEGLSVFEGRKTREGHYVIRLPSGSGSAKKLRLEVIRVSRERWPCYFVKGRLVGRGAAGEPLLRNVTHFERVPDEAIIAVEGVPSRYLEDYNIWRGGPLGERPELTDDTRGETA